MTTRRRLDPGERRDQLLDVGAHLFAAKPYHDVLMEDVAESAGISRALLYRYFPNKHALLAAIYRQATDRLLADTHIDPEGSLPEQVSAGLDVHFDYFHANRHTVLAANRTLAGDPVIQAIITDELGELRRRLLDATGLDGGSREAASAALTSWLAFVRVLCVEWLANEAFSRTQLHDMCVGALRGALGAITDADRLFGA
ncbi:TetR/AcrR family transcriptional regulator [Streptomyces sp. NPDC002537]